MMQMLMNVTVMHRFVIESLPTLPLSGPKDWSCVQVEKWFKQCGWREFAKNAALADIDGTELYGDKRMPTDHDLISRYGCSNITFKLSSNSNKA